MHIWMYREYINNNRKNGGGKNRHSCYALASTRHRGNFLPCNRLPISSTHSSPAVTWAFAKLMGSRIPPWSVATACSVGQCTQSPWPLAWLHNRSTKTRRKNLPCKSDRSHAACHRSYESAGGAGWQQGQRSSPWRRKTPRPRHSSPPPGSLTAKRRPSWSCWSWRYRPIGSVRNNMSSTGCGDPSWLLGRQRQDQSCSIHKG